MRFLCGNLDLKMIIFDYKQRLLVARLRYSRKNKRNSILLPDSQVNYPDDFQIKCPGRVAVTERER